MTELQTIRIMCPNLGCQRILAVPGRARGKLVKCRNCGQTIRIPIPQQTPSSNPGETTEDTPPAANETAA